MVDVPLHIDNVLRLEAEITIIVPSTKGVRSQRGLSKIEMDDRVNQVRKYLSKLFGGYTSVAATGGYVMKDGRLIQENVVKVTAFADKSAAIRYRDILLRKLKIWTVEFNQESMGLEWEGDFFIIPREKRSR